MNRAIRWFAENHVASNLLMALLILGGLFTLPGIKREVFPELDLDVISVSVEYPGAAPMEVEQAICVRIEEELQGLQGIKRIRATAAEAIGRVSIELLAGEDVRRRLDEIRTRVDAIDSFPEAAREPVVRQAEIRFQVLEVAVWGDVDEWTLKQMGEQARDEIASLPGITDVELVADRPYEIAIEVSEGDLRRYGITFDEVARAVQRSSLDLPGGSVKTEGREILLRTTGQAYRGSDFEDVVLVSRKDGTRLTLGDVAHVIDGFEESDQISRFDGERAVLVRVYRVGQQNALDISRQVKVYLESARDRLPMGVSYTLALDDSRFLRDRLATVTNNAKTGFALVLVVLALFLRLRLALWVCLGIPLSFLGALFLLPTFDVSINLISLVGFIVVLGIVVDDAIIVGENTLTEQSRLREPLPGAIAGAQGIATPVVFGVLTTIAAFAPMLWVPGPMGRIARVIPIVVCLCLFFSLLESLFVLPSHLGHGIELEREPRSRLGAHWRQLQDRIAAGLEHFTQVRYRAALERAIEFRYLTFATGVAVLMLTLGLLAGGWIKFVFQPNVEGDVTVAYVSMPQGTSASVTAEAVDQLARAAEEVAREIDPDGPSVFAHVFTSVGQQPYRLRQASGPAAFVKGRAQGSHLGQVRLEVVHSDQRSVTVTELTRRWRERTGSVPGAEELSFTSTIISAGAAVEVELSGTNLDELREAAAHYRTALAVYPGVLDLHDSVRGGKPELRLEILPSAEALGLSLEDLGRQVRQAFYGHEAQRIQRGRDDVRVMVRYPADQRRSLGDLENMRIRTADGSAVPFSAVARATLSEGFASIRRIDRRRVVTVTADIDPDLANANEILADFRARMLPELREKFPGLGVSFEGEQREQREFLSALFRGWVIALFVIYALLAVPLRSYLQPVIIMTAIPFGIVGAILGHLVMGHDFSMLSTIGFVALSGVVVNDSLILVDSVNRIRRDGADLGQALVAAAMGRFRAIMLTSLTTFAGLTPLLLETSVQARMLIPMGISLAFGVVFATLITLLLVPAIYLILEDLIQWCSRHWLPSRWIPEADAQIR